MRLRTHGAMDGATRGHGHGFLRAAVLAVASAIALPASARACGERLGVDQGPPRPVGEPPCAAAGSTLSRPRDAQEALPLELELAALVSALSEEDRRHLTSARTDQGEGYQDAFNIGCVSLYGFVAEPLE